MSAASAAHESAASGHALAAAAGLVTLLACLAVIQTTSRDAYWAGDCASRALLSERLLETGYSDLHLDYPAAALDPEGIAHPLPDLAFRHGESFASIFPIAYPALAAPLQALGGPAALRGPAALGTAACACLFGLWPAPVVGRRLAAAAGLGLGLATPLLFYGVVVWEHSLCVALGLAACVLATREDAAHLALAGALLGIASWLREEMSIAWLALALACGVTQRRIAAPLAVLAGGMPPLVALASWNALVYGEILGPHTAALDPARALALPARELPRRIAALVSGFGASPREALALAALALTAVAAGGIAEWRRRRLCGLVAAAALGLGVWLYGFLRAQTGAPLLGLVSYNGWLAQVPAVCLAGCGAVRLWRNPAGAPLRPGILAGVGFLFAASASGLATQSVFGTGLHIGPRLLLPALPVLWALALVALCHDEARSARRLAGSIALLLLAAGALSSVVGVRLLVQQESDVDALQRAIRVQPERVVVSGDAMLTQLLAGIWHEKPLLHARHAQTLRRVARRLREQKVLEFLVLAPEVTPIRDPIVAARCQIAGRHRGALGYVATDLLRCRLDSAPR